MPRVSPLHSQVTFRSQSSGVVFNIAGAWKFFTRPAQPSWPSRCVRSFCPPFGVFRLADPAFVAEPPEPPAPCRCAVATDYPLGNCDSPRLETSLNYLTRLGTASHRSSPPSPSFAFDDVRTPPEELVNSASPELALRFQRSRANQPGPAFPRSPGIILERSTQSFDLCQPLRSFNEL